MGTAYLGLDVVKRGRADDGEADEKDVGLGVGKRPQAIVILLPGGIPKTQADGLAVDHYTRRVIVEAMVPQEARSARGLGVDESQWRKGVDKHCGDVFARKGIGRVGNEQACLSNCRSAEGVQRHRQPWEANLADGTVTSHDTL